MHRKTKTPEQALSALMKYASRAERSSGDALRLMAGWGVPEPDRKAVLDRLVEMKFIDDDRFARAYARDKSRFAGWGVYKIRSGLAAKGIAKDVAERALAELDGSEGAEKFREVMARKAASMKKDEPAHSKKAKLMRFGLSRGYEYDKMIDLIEDILRDE